MKKNCTNCKHAEFVKKKSGRRNLNFGKCNIEILLPNSFIGKFSGDMPLKFSISKYTKPDCTFWEKIEKGKKYWFLDIPIESATGYQTFRVNTNTKEEAFELFKSDKGVMVDSQVEVDSLDDMEKEDFDNIYEEE